MSAKFQTIRLTSTQAEWVAERLGEIEVDPHLGRWGSHYIAPYGEHRLTIFDARALEDEILDHIGNLPYILGPGRASASRIASMRQLIAKVRATETVIS